MSVSLVETLTRTHRSVPARELCELVDLLRGKRCTVVAGAGCSTESGIPDYRGPTTLGRTRNPVQYRQFVDDAEWRKRYWARAVVGWQHFVEARPNPTHDALAALEAAGVAPYLITQNVDGLHQRAGQRAVVELHGSLHRVRCLDCGARVSRQSVQHALLEQNEFLMEAQAEIAPDGDAELASELIERFRVVGCPFCGGTLKPDVVYFGENVPKERVERAFQWVDDAECLFVVGSSLTVFSGYRFALRAKERGIPLAIVNLGPTRADHLADLKLDGRLGLVLPVLVEALSRAES
ncbi:MAG: NAD-dependent protein deacetylase [Myxococcota bacterium]